MVLFRKHKEESKKEKEHLRNWEETMVELAVRPIIEGKTPAKSINLGIDTYTITNKLDQIRNYLEKREYPVEVTFTTPGIFVLWQKDWRLPGYREIYHKMVKEENLGNVLRAVREEVNQQAEEEIGDLDVSIEINTTEDNILSSRQLKELKNILVGFAYPVEYKDKNKRGEPTVLHIQGGKSRWIRNTEHIE